MARLNKKNQDLHDLSVSYYVGEMVAGVGAKAWVFGYLYWQAPAESGRGCMDGMLMMLDIRLEMDRYVERIM